jgi:hypothetical protein
LFNIVAVDDFNMGAMENKSLNIFNSRYDCWRFWIIVCQCISGSYSFWCFILHLPSQLALVNALSRKAAIKLLVLQLKRGANMHMGPMLQASAPALYKVPRPQY